MRFKIVRTFHRAVQAEIQEIRNLQITEKDKLEAKALAKLIKAAANSYGIPVPDNIDKILEKTLSIGIRDLKDGFKHPENLLLLRIRGELKKELGK